MEDSSSRGEREDLPVFREDSNSSDEVLLQSIEELNEESEKQKKGSNWSDSSDEGTSKRRFKTPPKSLMLSEDVFLPELPEKMPERLREGTSKRRFKSHFGMTGVTEAVTELSPEFERRLKVLEDIQSLGPRATLAYQSALEAGKVQVYRTHVMLIGQDRAGKTSFKKSLLGLPFDPVEQSTDGVEVDPAALEIDVEQVENWQRIREKPGMALFGNGLVNIMAKELDGEIRKTVGYVPGKPNEKTSEQDKVPVEEAGHCDSNDAVLEPAIPELKINPNLPPEEFIDPLVERLIYADLATESSSKEHHITLDIWDFAGQYLYYACYPAFLSQRAVYLLIYNLSKGLKDVAQPRVSQRARDTSLTNPNQETNLENLLSWLASISTICSTKSDMNEKKEKDLPYRRPPIFIVGTHADKPVQNIRKVESEIQEEISGKEYDGHVIRPFFAVDNTKGCSDDRVEVLKKHLVKVLQQEPYMGEELPLRWFNFERVVQALLAEKVYFLELGRLRAIIQNICKIDNEEEIALMLDFYHKRREIVKHNETVVLQARWLINVFKQLITIRSFDDMEPRHGKLWKLMEEKGVLSMELVDHVFSKFCREGVIKEDILDMMEMFGLIAKFQTSPTEVNYFVPGQLRSPPTGLYKIELWPSDPCPLYIHFPSGFVPHGLFLQILTRCTKWCSENGFKKQPSFFDRAARFSIEKKFNFQLVIICRKRFLKVVLNELKGGCDASLADLEEVASFVRCFLEDSLQTISRDLPWFHNLEYEFCVECPHCQKEPHESYNHNQDSCVNEDHKCFLRILAGVQLSTCDNYYGGQLLTVPGLDKWFATEADKPELERSKDLLPGKPQGKNSARESPILRNIRSENVLQHLRVSKLDVNNATSTTDLRDKLNKIASDKGFIVCDNEGSGNCLFYALSEQLDLVKRIKISQEDLRLQLVQYLRENPTLSDGTELFNFVDGYSSWPDYLEKMANRGTWGDHVVLHAAANRFKTSIQVISSLSHNHNQTITPECHSDSIDRLVLGHVHELHYVSLRPRQVQVKKGNPTPDELQSLSLEIGDTWRDLGRRLKFGEADLQGFDHDKTKLRGKAYEMLIRWKQREASKATYLVLFEALCHEIVNRRDLGEKFCFETEL